MYWLPENLVSATSFKVIFLAMYTMILKGCGKNPLQYLHGSNFTNVRMVYISYALYIYIYVCVCVCVYIYIYTYIYICVCVCVCVLTYICH